MDNAAGCAAHTLIAIAFAADIVAGSVAVSRVMGGNYCVYGGLCVTARADQGMKNVGTQVEAMRAAPGVGVCKLRVGFAIHSEDSDPWPARRVLREWVLVLEPCLANMVDWGVRGTNKAAGLGTVARDRLRAGARSIIMLPVGYAMLNAIMRQLFLSPEIISYGLFSFGVVGFFPCRHWRAAAAARIGVHGGLCVTARADQGIKNVGTKPCALPPVLLFVNCVSDSQFIRKTATHGPPAGFSVNSIRVPLASGFWFWNHVSPIWLIGGSVVLIRPPDCVPSPVTVCVRVQHAALCASCSTPGRALFFISRRKLCCLAGAPPPQGPGQLPLFVVASVHPVRVLAPLCALLFLARVAIDIYSDARN